MAVPLQHDSMPMLSDRPVLRQESCHTSWTGVLTEVGGRLEDCLGGRGEAEVGASHRDDVGHGPRDEARGAGGRQRDEEDPQVEHAAFWK